MGIKKPVIQPKNKEKVIEKEIKKKPAYIVDYENIFKSKLKGNIKKVQTTPLQQEEEQHLKSRGFTPL